MKTNKGMIFGIALPILMVLVIAGGILAASGVMDTKGLTAGEVIGVEFSEIDRIRVSQEIYYLDDRDTALWATVSESVDMEAIYQAISDTVVEKGDGFDDGLAGGGSRFVNYLLKNGNQVELRFSDDQQLWLDSETCYWFETKFQLYDKLDRVLEGYTFVTAPGV